MDGQTVHHHLGVSAFADHAVIDRRSLVPVDDDVPPQVAAVLGCAVLTGGGAVINAGKPKDGDTVIVVGLGGVGMAALITAVSLGHGKVIGIDAVAGKRQQALELGASEVYGPAEALAAGVRAAVVIEAAGNSRAFETAIAVTDVGGTTVTVGLPAPTDTSTVAPLLLTAEARVIVGSYLGSAVPARDIPMFAQLWREGRLPVESLISSTVDLGDINSALDCLADGTRSSSDHPLQGEPIMNSADRERRLLESVPTGLLIGGEWRESLTGNRFAVNDPATGATLTTVADASAADAAAALDAAAAVQREWAATSPRLRGDILRRAFDTVHDRADDFALLMTLEMGKALAESRAEVNYGAEFLRWFSEEAVRVGGRYTMAPDGGSRLLVTKRPVGPACSSRPGTSRWPWPPARWGRRSPPAAR